MITKVVHHTNQKLARTPARIEEPDSHHYKDTTNDEINALIGITVFCAIFKSSREALTSLFSTSITGRLIFRAIMSEKHCAILFRALRFDDVDTRLERLKSDKTACISELFNDLITNCRSIYFPGAHLTIDETLVPYRGRVGFLNYNPKKAARYGIKIMGLADSHNVYICNAYIYNGKGSDGATLSAQEKKLLIPTQSLLCVSQFVYGTNRNITCDNWFVSLELAKELLKHGLTLVGTMKKNKPQIPSEFQPKKSREVGSSLYGYTEDYTVLSYVPKPNKAVVLLPSMDHSPFFDEQVQKPEIISFYNATKSGIDTLDMKCSNYSANRKTRRWPLAVFYHMIAMACSNAHILHSMYSGNEKMLRYDFNRAVAMSLICNHLENRLQIPNFQADLRALILDAKKEAEAVREARRQPRSEVAPLRAPRQQSSAGPTATDRLEKRKTCRYCPYVKKRRQVISASNAQSLFVRTISKQYATNAILKILISIYYCDCQTLSAYFLVLFFCFILLFCFK